VRRCVREALLKKKICVFFVFFLVPSKYKRFCLVCCDFNFLLFFLFSTQQSNSTENVPSHGTSARTHIVRFGGLVGYDACLTCIIARRRSSVRLRPEILPPLDRIV
jgi:hypothetical protein